MPWSAKVGRGNRLKVVLNISLRRWPLSQKDRWRQQQQQ